MYVVDLVAPGIVNTMPEKTLDAVADHGEVVGDTITPNYADAQKVLDDLEAIGVSYNDVVQVLETRGSREVREVVGRAAGRGHRGPGEGGPEGSPEVTALSVSASGPAADAIATAVPQLVEAQFASKLFAKDPTLWGAAAESESAKRLSWVGLGRTSRPLVGEIAALRDDLVGKGLDHVVLCGMGGSSLAPEVICATEGKELVVLDSSDPDYVRAALQDKLDRTVVVVSSKSGSTVETDSQKRAYEGASRDAGIDPTERIVIVTDPGSPLDKSAREAGYRVVNADPDVGGRYSALTAFGLVPSGLAGVDIEALLDDAESVADLLAADDDANPALRARRGHRRHEPAARQAGHRRRRLRHRRVRRLGGAAHRRVDRQGRHRHTPRRRGRRPGPRGHVAGARRHRGPAGQRRRRRRAGLDDTDVVAVDPTRSEVAVSGSLGAQMLLWEVAVAAAGRLLGINPFDQPDVESAKAAARELLDKGLGAAAAPAATDGAIEIRTMGGDGDWLGDATTVAGALDALFAQLDPNQGYVAVMAYLDRLADAPLASAASGHRAAHGATDDVRLGSAVPALDRPVPQGRPSGRRLPADHHEASGGSRHPRPGLHLRRLHRGPGRR